MTGTRLRLTRRAHLVLDLLDNRDGRRLRPEFGSCTSCGERVVVWDRRAVCMTRTDGGLCPGNGQPPKGQRP